MQAAWWNSYRINCIVVYISYFAKIWAIIIAKFVLIVYKTEDFSNQWDKILQCSFALWNISTCNFANLWGQTVPGRAPVGIESCPSRKNTSSPFLGSQEVLLLFPPFSLRPLLLQVPVLLSLPGWARCRWHPRVCTAAAAAAATGGLLPLHRGESWGGLLMLLPLWAPHQQRTLHQHRSDIKSLLPLTAACFNGSKLC